MVIADDDADLLAAFARTLARAGHDVTACPDADAALTQIRALGPDLVLTDIEMPPGMSGLEMVAAIRADPEIADIPIIVVTGGRIRAETAGTLGATLLLHKPLSPAGLIAHVEAVLAGGPVTPPGVATLRIGPGVVAKTDAEEPSEHAEKSDDYGQK
ncbi:response regulator [Planosporangium mesophilum]|uniref:Response regulatory domain-containing protein n=1 Tax=Planosporangium mesophilum TaxID=689768 RepID=A0A8J3TP04_9ACTN|nr:response regulator [Planosporangium mesophilum]NJC85753.1 response regulator [Planosporangium mesophilum]GII24780.1 hypothetical protein Pme01_43770 [Planosporangium mesophilum]